MRKNYDPAAEAEALGVSLDAYLKVLLFRNDPDKLSFIF